MKYARFMALNLVVCLALFWIPAYADHDDHHGKEHQKRYRHGRQESPKASALASKAYEQNCGSCHHAYYPGLLPTRSWQKILTERDNHFGEQIFLTGAEFDEVRTYLCSNAADISGNKRSRKIMRSIGESTPTRICDVVYIQDKHHELSAEVFKRKSVGGMGNCRACHQGASIGDFDDHRTVIPQ